MRSVKYVMVLWDSELEETLLKNLSNKNLNNIFKNLNNKKMSKNLKVEVHIGHYIQTFLSWVRFGGLSNYPLILSAILKINFALIQCCNQRGKLWYFSGKGTPRIAVSYKLAERELCTDNSSFSPLCGSTLSRTIHHLNYYTFCSRIEFSGHIIFVAKLLIHCENIFCLCTHISSAIFPSVKVEWVL